MCKRIWVTCRSIRIRENSLKQSNLILANLSSLDIACYLQRIAAKVLLEPQQVSLLQVTLLRILIGPVQLKSEQDADNYKNQL